MSTTRLIVTILVIALILAAGYAVYNAIKPSPSTPPSTTIQNQTSTQNQSNQNQSTSTSTSTTPIINKTVNIQNFSFNPSTVEVSLGSTVTWRNNDSAPHTITGDNGAFGSGTIQPGGSYSHTFNSKGTYAYHCSIHPYMTAQVIVK